MTLLPISPVKVTCPGRLYIKKEFEEAGFVDNSKAKHRNYGPSWYQELSESQISAADALGVSIKDDVDENTIWRVRKCLNDLGLFPMAKRFQIREVLFLCQSNDITFLWLMMQLYYATPAQPEKTQVFSINERIIMSVICHLDMFTTLRGLNQIIPHDGKPLNVHFSLLDETRPPPYLKPSPKPKTAKYKSPYLEPLTKPKIPKSKRFPMPLMPPISLAPYDKYEDSTFVVENEKTRWFGNQQKNHASRVAPDCRSIFKSIYCPDGSSPRDQQEYKHFLFDEFVSATHCCCNCEHKDKLEVPVWGIDQLESTKTNNEYIQVLKRIIRQILTRDLINILVFSPKCPKLSHINLCIDCEKCQKDYEKLKFIITQSNLLELSMDWQRQFQHIRRSIFESKSPVDLLKSFNEIAKKRDTFVHVSVRGVWMLNLYLWTPLCVDVTKIEDESCSLHHHVDPNNSQEMNEILIKGLNILKKDPTYVIPLLPFAHKHPVLQQWIRLRYGINYNRQVRKNLLEGSKDIWKNMLRLRAVKTRIPDATDVCPGDKHVTYDQKEEALKCLNSLVDAHFECIKTNLINDARQFYPTIEPFLSSGAGPPRKMFFSYMPARFRDIKAFRPWLPE